MTLISRTPRWPGRRWMRPRCRADFPILQQEINGHRLVYLDSASTSQKPHVVIDAVADYYREYNANVHRGIYTIGEKATAAYEKARARVARFINAPDSHEIVFTRNATEAINLVAYSWGRQNIDARRPDRPDRDGAPRQPRPVADPRPGEGRRPRVHPDHRRRHPPPRRLRGPAPAQAEARRVHPRLEHAGHDQPGPRDGRDGPRGGRAGPGRRRPGRAARAGRRPGARRRLLRVQRPQDAGPDGLGRAVGPARAARGDAAVPGRRRDDPRGPSAPVRTSTRSPGSSRRARRPSATPSGWAWPPST